MREERRTTMAISAQIVNGKIYANTTPDNLSEDTKGTSTTVSYTHLTLPTNSLV